MGLALEVGILADLRENDEEGLNITQVSLPIHRAKEQQRGSDTELSPSRALSDAACKKSIGSGAAIVFC